MSFLRKSSKKVWDGKGRKRLSLYPKSSSSNKSSPQSNPDSNNNLLNVTKKIQQVSAITMTTLVVALVILEFTGVTNIFNTDNEGFTNSPLDSEDNLDTNSDIEDNQAVSPAVKIESATATLKNEEFYSGGESNKICTITLSGTVTGPKGSFFLIKDGEMPDGSPGGLIDYSSFECPDWFYVGTSGVCTRNGWNSANVETSKATTQWNLTVEEGYFSSYSSKYMYPDYPAFTQRFTAILRIPTEDSEEEIMDSIYLTC